MITLYKVLANCTAILHGLVALYMLSVLFCAFLKRLPAWYLPLQIGIIGISCITSFTMGVCPLTFIEKRLRAAGGEPVYDGNFLNYYFTMYFQISLSDALVYRSIVLCLLVLIFVIVKRSRVKKVLV